MRKFESLRTCFYGNNAQHGKITVKITFNLMITNITHKNYLYTIFFNLFSCCVHRWLRVLGIKLGYVFLQALSVIYPTVPTDNYNVNLLNILDIYSTMQYLYLFCFYNYNVYVLYRFIKLYSVHCINYVGFEIFIIHEAHHHVLKNRFFTP